MEPFNPILIGASLALAVAAIGVMSVLSPAARAQFAYGQLCVMVGIYVGFAIAALDGDPFVTRADLSPLLIEGTLGLIFLLVGLAILQGRRWWLLGALILAHGFTDFLHLVIDGSPGPDWYAFACILYDALVGAAAIIMLSTARGARR